MWKRLSVKFLTKCHIQIELLSRRIIRRGRIPAHSGTGSARGSAGLAALLRLSIRPDEHLHDLDVTLLRADKERGGPVFSGGVHVGTRINQHGHAALAPLLRRDEECRGPVLSHGIDICTGFKQ